jgi:hypothetical protein
MAAEQPWDGKKVLTQADSYRHWCMANEVTAKLLREVAPGLSEAAIQHNAAALQARLTYVKPPLLITSYDVVRWEDEEKSAELKRVWEEEVPVARPGNTGKPQTHLEIICEAYDRAGINYVVRKQEDPPPCGPTSFSLVRRARPRQRKHPFTT